MMIGTHKQGYINNKGGCFPIAKVQISSEQIISVIPLIARNPAKNYDIQMRHKIRLYFWGQFANTRVPCKPTDSKIRSRGPKSASSL